ncbi:MAG TPA: LuxR C-terminal-related transcriptional regulator [Streptosporangiaceae bacterium]|nr:LuxR C-terminal-related transcriptional regulator [Streptosporangiaceae bacterium]
MTTTASGPVLAAPRQGVALLEDKLRIPRPGLAVLRRPRIGEQLDEAVSRPVTLITGPPGAGKTVAVAQWAAARPANRRPGWVNIDRADADPATFWRHVVAALSKAGALPGSRHQLPSELATPEIPQWISTAVRPASDPAILVLDDVHVLAGSAALDGLNELIAHEPPGLRLVLACRSAVGLATSRLRLEGELADLGAADLACTADETAAYFAMLGRPVSQAERDHLMRRTEGWLAGLRLTALAGHVDQVGAHALVAEYLQDEVLGRQPQAVREFMMRTSLSPTVPADLAHLLSGEPGAAGLLEHLSRETGLVQALTPDSGEYRYHPMLREVLAVSLRLEMPEEVPGLQRRVAHWHAERGEVLPAVQAAAAIGEWEFGLHVLRDAGPVVMFSAAGPGLEAALAGMPPGQLTTDEALDVALAVALAAARIWQGDADGALPHLERAEAGLPVLPAGDRDQTELWIAALRVLLTAAVTAPEPGWLEPYWTLATQAHADPRGVGAHRALGTLWLAIGFAALRECDDQQARSAFLHAGAQLSAGGLLALRELGRCWEAVAAARYGDLSAATRIAGSVADGPHGRDDDLVPVLALAAAAVRLARDEPEAARTLLDDADLAAMTPRPSGEPSIAVFAGLLRARLAMADGNLAGARGLARWLGDAAAAAPAAGYIGTPVSTGTDRAPDAAMLLDGGSGRPRRDGLAAAIAVLDADISLAAGELERARSMLAEMTENGSRTRPDVAICQAKLLIASEDDKGALTLIGPVLADPSAACSVADRIAALLAAVVARRRLSQGHEAAELLAEALALAEPDDACGAFVAAGPAVRSALTVLISPSSRCAGFAGRILDRFDGRLPRPASAQPAALLTDSELAVLRFLPSHMTNQEIAESLFLSINTIKTHLSSVYRKLGVANRRQAIAQGRRLELLLGRAVAIAMISADRCARDSGFARPPPGEAAVLPAIRRWGR